MINARDFNFLQTEGVFPLDKLELIKVIRNVVVKEPNLSAFLFVQTR